MVAETCWLAERIFGKNPNGYWHIRNKLQLESKGPRMGLEPTKASFRRRFES